MNSASAQPLSGIPPAAQPASHRAQDICARIDALLATLLLWATRTGLLGRAIAPQLHAIAGAFRALSVLLARLAAGDLPLPVMASTLSCRTVSCRTVSCRASPAAPPIAPGLPPARGNPGHASAAPTPPPCKFPPPEYPGTAPARCPNAPPRLLASRTMPSSGRLSVKNRPNG